ncbi:3-methyladenine DNA glycosylase AlkC [Leucobacter luti]|uniref:3-methyladenine DNA glycosylase AlkC n=1 Tax=Leucobacter luti TaxID=340320 RepID=A0A4R6S725_9MICO|nr:DNA alkylation repair protein [Leucobacter luti]TDP95709.1 3-methyladenine DNA glycosylase AlkC [Leucobacter luti]
MPQHTKGRGASRTRDITPEHLAALNSGTAQARTLTEALAIDHRRLLAAVIPDASRELTAAVDAAHELGILKRMTAIGHALTTFLEPGQLATLRSHPSDTARGWVCFAIGAADERVPERDAALDLDPAARMARLLTRIRPLADDACFTVREWAWMGIRPALITHLHTAIGCLTPWTAEASPYLRRFASEALRPRGVWAAHIGALKSEPELGEALLEPLRSDPERYVQDSVANWINDAARTRPDWAHALGKRWLAESPSPETTRIVARGLRSLS